MFISNNSLWMSRDKGVSWKVISTGMSEPFVSADGAIYLRDVHNSTGLVKLLVSYDFGETFLELPMTGLSFFSSGTYVQLQNGNVVSVADTIYRAARQYNYDTTTQFKTPAIKAPRNQRAYIKAKAA